jgi:hypothetical protein
VGGVGSGRLGFVEVAMIDTDSSVVPGRHAAPEAVTQQGETVDLPSRARSSALSPPPPPSFLKVSPEGEGFNPPKVGQ